MTEQIPHHDHQEPKERMTSGIIYLTTGETNILALRKRARDQSTSRIIYDIMQEFVEVYESSTPDVQQRLLQKYYQDVLDRANEGLTAFRDRQGPPYAAKGWVLPKSFVDKLSTIALKVHISHQSLMTSVISDAITGKCQ